MNHPLLFEINTRCRLAELSENTHTPVTLGSIPESEFAEWKRWGVSHVWLMGIWQTGPQSESIARAQPEFRRILADHFGSSRDEHLQASPYAISAYHVPEELGGDAGLASFRKQLQAHGLKLVLDFVPNHVGLDHPWLITNSELFVQGPREHKETFLQETTEGARWIAHGKDPYFPAWTDTAQLDYRSVQTRAAMAALLQSVAHKCDGVRCDMAMLLLNDVFAKTWEGFGVDVMPSTEFWPEAIRSVRQSRPEFIFIAEAYWDTERLLQEQGFDFTYDKEWLDDLVGKRYLQLQRRVRASNGRSVRFLENHDEPRIASRLDPAEQRPAALFLLAQHGMRLLYSGQLAGRRLRTPVQFTHYLPEKPDPMSLAFYNDLLTVIQRTAIGRGNFRLLDLEATTGSHSVEDCFLIEWSDKAQQSHIAAVNLGPELRKLRLREPIGLDWDAGTIFGNNIPVLRSSNSALFELPPYAASIVELTRIS